MEKNKKNKEKAYDNKFMTNWAENEPPEHFAGDKQTDNLTVENDYNENLDLRITVPMGRPFMHPMHDATLDTYNNDLNLQAEPTDEEEDKKEEDKNNYK